MWCGIRKLIRAWVTERTDRASRSVYWSFLDVRLFPADMSYGDYLNPEFRGGAKLGAMTKMILAQPRGAFFTAKTFVPPLTNRQAVNRCRQLWLAGKLRKVRESEVGRNRLRAVFCVA